MKTTKYITATYDIATGEWNIRNNYEIIVKGQGVRDYAEALREVEATTTKRIIEKIKD